MSVEDLVKELEKQYPNDITLFKGLSLIEVEAYIAKLEMIEHIKLIIKDTNSGR